MPRGVAVSGLESNGSDQFFCGGGSSGKVRAVRPAQPRVQNSVRTIDYYRWANIIFNTLLYPILLYSTPLAPSAAIRAADDALMETAPIVNDANLGI
jgi:hypothetical protein